MRTLLKLTVIEMKLFIREPITMFFTFALPVLFLFVLGNVFDNVSTRGLAEFRPFKPMDFYTPAYICLVLTSIGVVGLPGHLASYRERSVLRRFRASSLSLWRVYGAQALVSIATAAVGGIMVIVAAAISFNVKFTSYPLLILAAFLVNALSFVSLGMLLGAILPNSRASQGVGLVLFFVMLILGGAGPPRSTMTDAMIVAGDFTPLRHSVTLMQDAWLGRGWNWTEFGIVAAIFVASLIATALVVRRNS